MGYGPSTQETTVGSSRAKTEAIRDIFEYYLIAFIAVGPVPVNEFLRWALARLARDKKYSIPLTVEPFKYEHLQQCLLDRSHGCR